MRPSQYLFIQRLPAAFELGCLFRKEKAEGGVVVATMGDMQVGKDHLTPPCRGGVGFRGV